jgi:hypothetical protein
MRSLGQIVSPHGVLSEPQSEHHSVSGVVVSSHIRTKGDEIAVGRRSATGAQALTYPYAVGRLEKCAQMLVTVDMDIYSDSQPGNRLEIVDTGRRRTHTP